ncbi:Uncharacterised protein [Leclercia adecarboxylata]|uniref:Uncharacterized protein n=1 Tax=Leclercia adecarboxylata TaxID=83655 RepID=A0A4U9HJN5_9ENTR|nr:Uncharacterised protein [Leclercia adecarboxylata]
MSIVVSDKTARKRLTLRWPFSPPVNAQRRHPVGAARRVVGGGRTAVD